MTLVVTGGRVLSATSPRGEARDIVIEGDTIVDLVAPGSVHDDNAERLDATRRLIIPGLINSHTHSHGEVIYVLSGEANVDGGTVLKPNDSICIPGNFRYGITVGDEGLTMLTIRAGDATSNFKS